MSQPQWEHDEGWIGADPSRAADFAAENDTASTPTTELEPGWRAIRALMQIRSDELLAVMLRPSFRPVRDLELVTVNPCLSCLDGGIRTAGSVRLRRGRLPVRACDTCGIVEIGDLPTLPKQP